MLTPMWRWLNGQSNSTAIQLKTKKSEPRIFSPFSIPAQRSPAEIISSPYTRVSSPSQCEPNMSYPVELKSSPPTLQTPSAPQYSPVPGSNHSHRWGIHWRTPTLMIGTFVLAIVLAVVHDAFYTTLVDNDARYQRMSIFAGTGLAFLTKTLLAACVGTCHRQRIWRTLRDKPISIGGIDALFEVMTNPLNLFDLDMILHAKLSLLMAGLSWLLPISALLAPTTITVIFKEFPSIPAQTPVPQVNVTGWNWYSNGNIFATSLMNYKYNNVTDKFLFTGVSPRTRTLVAEVAYGGDIVSIPSPCTDNCSYVIEFDAPTLSCQQEPVQSAKETCYFFASAHAEALTIAPCEGAIGLLDPAPDTDGILPYCRVNYNATLEPVPETSTEWKSGLRNRLRVTAGTSVPLEAPRKLSDIQNVLCTPYFATYSVGIKFTNRHPVFDIQGLKLLSPIDESVSEVAMSAAGTGGFDHLPSRALVQGLYDVLLGWIAYTMIIPTILITNTTITATKLANTTISTNRYDDLDWRWRVMFKPDLASAIEELSHNLTLSLLSITDLTAIVSTESTTTRLVYAYSRMALVLSYAIAVAATLFCLVVGLTALRSNGIASDVSFSRVLVTTRNPTLDNISRGSCLGGDPYPRYLRKTRLKFGELGTSCDEAGVTIAHAGFGTEKEVVKLRKGVKYV